MFLKPKTTDLALRLEINRMEGRLCVLQTILAKLLWRCAKAAPDEAEWLNLFRAGLCGALHSWRDDPPFGQTAMEEAEARLGEILHALQEAQFAAEAARKS